MKIARIEHEQTIRYALVEDEGYRLIEGDPFGGVRPGDTLAPMESARLLAPVVPRQIIAIGANYRKHCEECNVPIPERPVVFLKGANTLIGPEDSVMIPHVAPDEVDYEAELAIVIGKEARHVSEADADQYILGYTCANDVSARDVQLKQDMLWARGKSFDTFCPVGPWIETGLNGGDLGIKLTLNRDVMQNARTDDLIFSIPYLIHYLSQCMTLYPGSIILTGTPWGVGMGRDPKVFLKSGDIMTVEIEGIGSLVNPVLAECIS